MMKPEQIDSNEDLRLWAVEHEAKTCACRQRHEEIMKGVVKDMNCVKKRLWTMEQRGAWLSGVFAGVGALIGVAAACAFGQL